MINSNKSNKLNKSNKSNKLNKSNKSIKLNKSNNLIKSNLLDLYYNRFLYLNKEYLIKTIENLVGLTSISLKLKLKNCNNYYYDKFKKIISREL